MFLKRLKKNYKLWIIMVLALTGMLFILTVSALSLKPVLYNPGLYWLH
jgi:hypothetical protein